MPAVGAAADTVQHGCPKARSVAIGTHTEARRAVGRTGRGRTVRRCRPIGGAAAEHRGPGGPGRRLCAAIFGPAAEHRRRIRVFSGRSGVEPGQRVHDGGCVTRLTDHGRRGVPLFRGLHRAVAAIEVVPPARAEHRCRDQGLAGFERGIDLRVRIGVLTLGGLFLQIGVGQRRDVHRGRGGGLR